MVELCELKLLPEADAWPADIDTQIANLDFGGGDSVLFESFDPSVSTDSLDSEQLREQCRPRIDDYKMTFADSGHWQSGIRSPPPVQGLTTWGRIRSTEPLDDRTVSAPDIAANRATSASHPRPASLLANFVDGRRSLETRYVDLNDNEIATTGTGRQTTSQQATTSPISNTATTDRWRFRAATAPAKPRRTFADLQKKMAPELQFLALPHQVPLLCDESSSLSLSDVIVNVKREGLPRITSDLDAVFPNLLQDDTPDSGLGCSGPTHIEDWSSLSVLLPKHVADACSFFKNNSQLLSSEDSNCIDRSRRSEPCRTCFRVRRRLHPPSWAHSATSRHVLCDCQTTSDFQEEGHDFAPRTSGRPATVAGTIPRPSLRARELSVVGLPIYAVKRQLVEAVVEGVAAVARGDGPSVLIVALEALVADGLNEDCSVWHMIRTVTAPGPATKDVYSIVKQLDSSEKSNNSRVQMFFEQLLRESSLDCWMCYVVLKENVLKRLYGCGSFLLTSPTAYRSLLWRLIDSLALIPVLEARECCSSSMQTRSMWTGVPSRIASDSRVPKSSSVPARLSANLAFRPSRIPLPMKRCELSRTQSRSPSRSFIASVRSDNHDTVPQGHLPVWQGERVRVLSRRGDVARCCRTQPRRGCIISGVIPLNNLLIQ